MSEDFDKEAEREKLREQFEADQQRREATQQMSELLLKGATMTNKHCDTCGDPVFRHDGQEFCANCQTVATEGSGGERQPDAAAGQPPEERGGAPEAGGDPRRAEPRAESDDDQPRDHATVTDDDGVSEVPVEAQSDPDRRRAADDGDPTTARRERTPRRESGRNQPRSQPTETADADGLEAPAALQRALEKFSRQAAATDDPREAKHHLAAAREAAEALSALQR